MDRTHFVPTYNPFVFLRYTYCVMRGETLGPDKKKKKLANENVRKHKNLKIMKMFEVFCKKSSQARICPTYLCASVLSYLSFHLTLCVFFHLFKFNTVTAFYYFFFLLFHTFYHQSLRFLSQGETLRTSCTLLFYF